jgi:arylsulfatase A-like enzyme
MTACAVTVFAAGAAGADNGTPPNIVFILADDLGIMDVGAYATHLTGRKPGGLYYETPNIDSLVEKGIAFSQAYSNQLCSPTRAAILTGRIASRLGVTTATPRTKTYYNQGITPPEGYSPHDAFGHKDAIDEQQAWLNAHSNTAVSPEIPTLPQVLKTHDCAYIGKWHLGGHGALGRQPRDHGFEEIAYFDAGGSPYFNWREAWDNRKHYSEKMPQPQLLIGTSGEPTDKTYLTNDLTVQAQRYLRERAQTPEDPFFLYFAHFSVHTPLQAEEEYVVRFEDRDTRGNGGHDNPTYAAMVKHLDDSVGAIMQTLEKTGLAKNTLVVFSSDNGGVEYTNPPATDNFPFKGGKACLYEGGVRVPLVYYLPGRFERAWCDSPVDCTDFLPTFAGLTGNSVPADIDGQNITALLESPVSEAQERTIIWHYPFNVKVKHPDNGMPLTPHSAIRVGDYKLIWDWHGRLELYDVPDDPYEQNDLVAAMPEKTNKLFRELCEWLEENVEQRYLPRRNPDYDPTKDERGYAFRDLRE